MSNKEVISAALYRINNDLRLVHALMEQELIVLDNGTYAPRVNRQVHRIMDALTMLTVYNDEVHKLNK